MPADDTLELWAIQRTDDWRYRTPENCWANWTAELRYAELFTVEDFAAVRAHRVSTSEPEEDPVPLERLQLVCVRGHVARVRAVPPNPYRARPSDDDENG